jgi:serine/threonine protein kinase
MNSEVKLQAVRLLARGSFGLVWKMRLAEKIGGQNYGTYVAVKELKRSDTREANDRELRILSASSRSSTSVIELLCHFETDTNVFYCMECFGQALDTLLLDSTIRKNLDIVSVFRGILSALTRLHEIQVIHRDIKCNNIVVQNNVAKLIDFGSACECNTGTGTGNSNQEKDQKDCLNDYHAPVVGTLQYRSPEQLFASTSYDSKVDMWAAGCILAELLKSTTGPLLPALTESDLFLRQFFLLGAPTQTDIYAMGLTDENSQSILLGLTESGNNIQNSFSRTRTRLEINLYNSDEGGYGIGLLRRLLVYSPMERVTAEEALMTSPFFSP